MGKFRFILFISTFLILIQPSNGQNHWINPDTKKDVYIRSAELERDVEFLSDSLTEGRSCGSIGHCEAAFYIARRFSEMNLVPFDSSFVKSFQSSSQVGHNIVGLAVGGSVALEEKHKNEYIIVGCHYDYLGTLCGKLYPGADAGVSGVAAVLGVAKMFQKQRKLYNYPGNVIFVAFDGYFNGWEGSMALIESIRNGQLKNPVTGETIRIENIRLMVDIDQIGSSLSPFCPEHSDYLIAIGEESMPKEKQGNIGRCNWFYYCDLDLHYDYYGSENFTRLFYNIGDRKIFIQNHIPTVYFTSGITEHNNKTSDTFDTLDYEVFRKRVILIFRFIEKSL